MKHKNTLKVLLTTFLGLFTLNVFAAAGETQTIVLSTDVASVCTIESSVSSFEPNMVDGEDDTTVATITEICNDFDGYTVTFSSANGGKLQNSDVAGEQKDYKISYNDIDEEKLDSDRTTTYDSETESNDVELKMHLDENSGILAAGTWSDTITATVAVVD